MSTNDFESKHPRKTDGKWKQADHPENEVILVESVEQEEYAAEKFARASGRQNARLRALEPTAVDWYESGEVKHLIFSDSHGEYRNPTGGPTVVECYKSGAVLREAFFVGNVNDDANAVLHNLDGPALTVYNEDGSVNRRSYCVDGKAVDPFEAGIPTGYTPPVPREVENDSYMPTVVGPKASEPWPGMTAVAKDVRAEIKKAKEAAYLPRGIDVSVRKDGASNMRLTVKGMSADDVWETLPSGKQVRTPEAEKIQKRLRGIADMYNTQSSDDLRGYSDSTYIALIEFDTNEMG